jgi:Zn-dependent peptidase ImmA (M78 family)
MKANHQKAKKTAIQILDSFSIVSPPVNPVEIARKLGIKVLFANFGGDASKEVSGFYDFEENTIYVNKEEYPLRQTFTIAHEIGHKQLHAEWVKSSDYKVLLRSDTNKDSIEKEADSFAANLLVPRFMLDKYYERSVTELSILFAVSVPVIKNRLSFEYGI